MPNHYSPQKVRNPNAANTDWSPRRLPQGIATVREAGYNLEDRDVAEGAAVDEIVPVLPWTARRPKRTRRRLPSRRLERSAIRSGPQDQRHCIVLSEQKVKASAGEYTGGVRGRKFGRRAADDRQRPSRRRVARVAGGLRGVEGPRRWSRLRHWLTFAIIPATFEGGALAGKRDASKDSRSSEAQGLTEGRESKPAMAAGQVFARARNVPGQRDEAQTAARGAAPAAAASLESPKRHPGFKEDDEYGL